MGSKSRRAHAWNGGSRKPMCKCARCGRIIPIACSCKRGSDSLCRGCGKHPSGPSEKALARRK